MTTVPIAIDLRPFLHPFDPHTANPLLVLVGPSGEIFLSAPQQSLQLQPGRYEFVVASGVPSDFTFDVTAAGLVEYDPSFDTFLSGRGSRTLVIKGFEINFDARYLSGPISLFVSRGPGAWHAGRSRSVSTARSTMTGGWTFRRAVFSQDAERSSCSCLASRCWSTRVHPELQASC